MTNERYIGDGVYASLFHHMIKLRTNRVEKTEEAPPGWEGLMIGDTPITVWDRHVVHWIALEPEVLAELIIYAYEIGWGSVVENARIRDLKRMHDEQRTRPISDDEYARDEEDKQRKRDAAEGFDD